jgi:hypothetical protein
MPRIPYSVSRVDYQNALQSRDDAYNKLTQIKLDYKTQKQLHESEIEDKNKEIETIKDVIKRIYALRGEDKEINRLCNLVL